VDTLRDWDNRGILIAASKTFGTHRRYRESDVRAFKRRCTNRNGWATVVQSTTRMEQPHPAEPVQAVTNTDRSKLTHTITNEIETIRLQLVCLQLLIEGLVEFANRHGFQDIIQAVLDGQYTFRNGRLNSTKLAKTLGISQLKAKERLDQLRELLNTQLD
jgi:DNA-binding transcriptional MerR regulator